MSLTKLWNNKIFYFFSQEIFALSFKGFMDDQEKHRSTMASLTSRNLKSRTYNFCWLLSQTDYLRFENHSTLGIHANEFRNRKTSWTKITLEEYPHLYLSFKKIHIYQLNKLELSCRSRDLLSASNHNEHTKHATVLLII